MRITINRRVITPPPRTFTLSDLTEEEMGVIHTALLHMDTDTSNRLHSSIYRAIFG